MYIDKFELKREYLVNKNSDIDYECPLCLSAIDLDSVVECLSCQKLICKGCHDQMKDKNECPQCRSKEGFRMTASRLLKQMFEKEMFQCPNCEGQFPYKKALKHFPICGKGNAQSQKNTDDGQAQMIEDLLKELECKDVKIKSVEKELKEEKLKNKLLTDYMKIQKEAGQDEIDHLTAKLASMGIDVGSGGSQSPNLQQSYPDKNNSFMYPCPKCVKLRTWIHNTQTAYCTGCNIEGTMNLRMCAVCKNNEYVYLNKCARCMGYPATVTQVNPGTSFNQGGVRLSEHNHPVIVMIHGNETYVGNYNGSGKMEKQSNVTMGLPK